MKTLITLTLVLVLAACSGDDATPQPSADPVADPVVTIRDMEFVGGTVTVEAGTTVTWVWEDAPMEHNVVFDGFESPLQAEGTYRHTFEEAGTFDYDCGPHPFMTGTITVVEPDTA
jgi:plastocyanin